LRISRWIALLLVAFAVLATDIVLANIPGPIPEEQAINNVEHDPTFVSLIKSRVIEGQTINGTYYYTGFSNDPRRDFYCVHNLYGDWFHYLNPFHEYSTTTLIFAVEFKGTQPLYDQTYALLLINLFIQVNPNTGQILSLQQEPQCL
jgi:hypothetical protein